MDLGNLFSPIPILRQVLGGAGASPQPATIQKTNGERNPAAALEKVNADLPESRVDRDLPQQLHAALEPNSAKAEAHIPDNGIKVTISKDTIQKVLTVVEPFLSDFRGILDKFLSTPFDKPMTGGEFFGKYLTKLEPLMEIVIPSIMNYLDKFPTGQTSLNPANAETAIATPA